MADGVDLESLLNGWEPPAVTIDDTMDPGPARALAAVLDRPEPPDGVLPALWHWVHFVSWPPTAALGTDGHPSDGDFLPPIPDRTRMFVGGRLEIATALRIGTVARRTSTVIARTVKTGRTGPMLFVTVRHEIFQDGALAVVDEQDLMYRSGATTRPAAVPGVPSPGVPSPGVPSPGVSSPGVAGAPLSAPAPPAAAGSGTAASSEAPWQEPFMAGPTLLFRFSALTANSHRIHYDEPYATGIEGYPGLVVHGPLLAVLMAGLAERRMPERRLSSLHYRFIRPVFAEDRILLTGRPDGNGAEMDVVAADSSSRAHAEAGYVA